ncbi:MAG: ribonuclease 3 [Planctomycetaceae bacterium]|nr:MAG: ribonuclease 3 [Planctomycetaceae bacterium]
MPSRLAAACESRLGYTFRDRELLTSCLTHASAARTRLESNERLEFLGDAILGACVCEWLYLHYPRESEGELTRLKSALVSRRMCAHWGKELHLPELLIVGKGIRQTALPASVVAAAFEALLAGIYLDGGLEPVRRLVHRLLEHELHHQHLHTPTLNYKSLLQQLAQRQLGKTPVYRTIEERGPDHSKSFCVVALIGEQQFTSAWGLSKKEAEQRAAANAWHELHREAPPYPPSSQLPADAFACSPFDASSEIPRD